MRGLVTAAALALGLAACGTTETYEANYDALSRLRADCLAKGGELKLKDVGNPEHLQDYACVRK